MSVGKIIKFDPKRKKRKDREEIKMDLSYARKIVLSIILRNLFSGTINTFAIFMRFIVAGAIVIPVGAIWFFGKYQSFAQFIEFVQSQWFPVIVFAIFGVFFMWGFRTRYMMPWNAVDGEGTVIPLRALWQRKT